MKRGLPILLGLFTTLFSSALLAANIVIQNIDGGGEGFNDATVVSPIGGNSGMTLGQQRLNVFAYAAAHWGALLDSNVTIVVESSFDPMTCSASQAVLGGAAPETIHRNFLNAPFNNTYYPAALASSLANSDLNGSTPEISITFNSSIDNNNNCLNNTNWYYGLDGNAPSGTIDLRSVVLHELGHGLGFTTFVNVTTGAKFSGRNDAFMLHLEDHSLGLAWPAMSDAQRAASATDNGDLHWTGASVTASSEVLSAGVSGGHVRMYAPTTLAVGSSVAHFDTVLFPNQLMEPSNIGSQSSVGLALSLLEDIGWTVFAPANTAPTISAISNRSTNEDTLSSAITFTVGDAETAAGSLSVTASSSDTAIVPNSGLTLGGSGANRTLTAMPASNANGIVTITVTVSDGELNANRIFQLTVDAVNDDPVVAITNPANAAVFGESMVINFTATASDIEDGNIASAVQWSSNQDGVLGSGASLSRNLSPGNHMVSASVTDSGGSNVVAQIGLTINPDWDLDGDGMADAWEQATFGTLTRDGTGDFDGDGISDLQEYLNSLTTGDINNNGSVDAGDVVLAQRHVLGLIQLTPEQISRGDLYPASAGDGVLNTSDLILLLQLVLN